MFHKRLFLIKTFINEQGIIEVEMLEEYQMWPIFMDIYGISTKDQNE